MFRAAVELVDQCVLEHHPAAGLAHIGAHLVHQLMDGPCVGHRHDLLADGIVRGMEGDAQGHRQTLSGKAPDLGHQTAGAQ